MQDNTFSFKIRSGILKVKSADLNNKILTVFGSCKELSADSAKNIDGILKFQSFINEIT